MATLNGRKVQMVRLHSATHVQGIGQIGPAIDSNSGKVIGALDLTMMEGGVYITGKGLSFFIPFGNIQLITLAPESTVVPFKK